MKYILYLLGAVLTMSACHNIAKAPATDSIAPAEAAPQPEIKATYSGDFSGTPIYITINYAKGRHLAGYNSHKGLRRNLSGDIQPEGNGWKVTLREPGDHPFDGAFSLHFNADYTLAKGNWKPNNTDSLREKVLTLNRVNESGAGGGIFANEHGDINFEDDGVCILKYYPALTDSTWEEQMQIVRGTWKKVNDTTLRVNWVMHERFGKKTSDFTLDIEKSEGSIYVTGVRGEGLSFSSMP